MEDETPLLESCSFEFSQSANCLNDSDYVETIQIEYNSSLGIDRDGDGFFVLKTEKWSLSSIDDLQALFDRIKRVLNPPTKQ